MPEYETLWELKAKGLLRAEMARHHMTYKQLVKKLSEVGVVENEHNLRSKVARGKFTAAFFLACLGAMEARDLRLD